MKNLHKKIIAIVLVLAMVLPMTAFAYTYDELKERKTVAHEIAELARSIGATEDNEIILNAKRIWHDADDKMKAGDYEKPEKEYVKYYTDSDALMLAKVTFCESRGIPSKTELACVMWTVLNRVDAGYANTISAVILAPNQFAYRSSAPTVNDYGVDLLSLAYDVLERWNKEKNGESDVGRVLPQGYLWYSGNGKHNFFRDKYRGGNVWNYSWPTPYDS